MIKISLKSANYLEHINILKKQYSSFPKRLWIGRGQDLQQKQAYEDYIFDAFNLSQSISRIHACLVFPPYFRNAQILNNPPNYLSKITQIKDLPYNILLKIWQYCQPLQIIILNDMHSLHGVFQQAFQLELSIGLEIMIGATTLLKVLHQENYSNQIEVQTRIKEYRAKGYVILQEQQSAVSKSFILLSIKNTGYLIFGNQNISIKLGRSSNSQIVIEKPDISRNHALIVYKNGLWILSDGTKQVKSRNGIWKKIKKAKIDIPKQSCDLIHFQYKIGDLLAQFSIIRQFSILNLDEFNKSNNGDNKIEQFCQELYQNVSLSS